MKVILHGKMIFNSLEKLKNFIKIPCKIERFNCDYTDKQFVRSLETADVLVSMELPSYIKFPKNLKLLQIPGIGLDKVDFSNIPLSVPVCIAPQHEDAVAEYIVMSMLIWLHNFKRVESTFRNGSWEMSSRYGGPLNNQLKGKKVGIIGYGKIGRSLAKKLKAFDTKIYCCNRSEILDPNLNRSYNLLELNDMLKEVDFIVISIALTDETKNIINTESFNRMKPNAVIINIARGECIEEEALFNACKNKKIAGAIIDVWYQYPSLDNINPSPSKYPFHQLDNVIMTPHSSAWTEEVFDERLKIISENIIRIAENRELLYLITQR